MTSHISFLLGKVECPLLTQEVAGPSSLSPTLMKGSGLAFFNYWLWNMGDFVVVLVVVVFQVFCFSL